MSASGTLAVVDEDAAPEEGGQIRELHLETTEVLSELAPGITFNYWTFNNTVPGPLFRVREGDIVRVTITNNALNPGLFVYHCATPNMAVHMAHGMYGMILVEPKDGLPAVDKEFYVMQGEIFTTGAIGRRGLQAFDAKKMMLGNPTYITFNGRPDGVVNKMKAEVESYISWIA